MGWPARSIENGLQGSMRRPAVSSRRCSPAAVAVTLLAALLAGCSQVDPARESFDFSHVHGLGYNPSTNTIYVATHHGLIVGNESDGGWAWDYAGEERYDYMGFTQDSMDPSILYSSGHPDDPRAYGGVHLGVRRSTDGGATWEQRSLKGQVDFHSLTSIPGVEGGLVGVWKGDLMESRDGGLSWKNHTVSGTYLPFDAAVTDHHVYVTSADGLIAGHLGNASSWNRHAGGHGEIGTFFAIAAAPDGSVMFAGTGNGRSGTTYRSTDLGLNWTEIEHDLFVEAAVPLVFAFDPANVHHVLAATVGGAILESRDAGITWDSIRRP